ncbi:hypothetical protein Ocin01_03674 [Orchesella cincta]|uniref:Uncharacterized protein n=1 Tax=Orchesella cincta TaxID=48709 RepID=A0A1D2NDI9_ORCCI|nr:hypothetical protein Ocin01_03674 [Orchesella cincta]
MAFTAGASTEVEASSFSVWNCVITFLQILLISTMLYGVGYNNQGQVYDMTPELLSRFQHFRAVAFFFCVWALQSVALALLLVWAIGKKSYHLCHSWVLCEALMQIFIIVSGVYFAYRSLLSRTGHTTVTFSDSEEDHYDRSSSYSTQYNTTRFPKHLIFLVILHFLIKGFGFWIVWRYMKLLKTCNVQVLNSEISAPSSSNRAYERQISPPPAYSHLCKDDLPCYDEALKLCLKNSERDVEEGNNRDTKTTALLQV